MSRMVRVRFAPSPTGNLHIGTLRTALFSWLYARHFKGEVVLRIEDTDKQRSEKQYEDNIFEGLEWFGLDYDELYRQSDRIDNGLYTTWAKRLLAEGKAYYCFDTDEELEAEREEAKRKGVPYKYSRRSLNLSATEVKEKLESGEPYTIRFKMPDVGELTYTDLIRGDISFDLGLQSDFVILKSDGSPSYNFAVVVDDASMKITHVIRGEDHISNMPRQLILFRAFEEPEPQYAHMPMILGEDKAKLSKRHGATSVTEYRDQGYLPHALFNYLSLLGWKPEGEEEFFAQDEIVKLFTIDRVSKSNAVFDQTKLTWMNGQYIRKMDEDTFYETVLPFVSEAMKEKLSVYDEAMQKYALYSVAGNLNVLSEIDDYASVFVKDEATFKADISEIEFNKDVIGLLKKKLSKDDFSKARFEAIMNEICDELELGKGKVFLPIRFAISGQKQGPHIGDLAHVFGYELVVSRLDIVLA